MFVPERPFISEIIHHPVFVPVVQKPSGTHRGDGKYESAEHAFGKRRHVHIERTPEDLQEVIKGI